jgi:tRNA (uracil-5-)-methyltransferase
MPLSHFKPDIYSNLLEQKTARLTQLLSIFNAPTLEVFSSPTTGFRMRAEFRFWHNDGDAFYAMFPKGDSNTAIRVDEFPIAHTFVNHLMQKLRQAVLASSTLLNRLFQVEFLCTLNGDHLITLIYHRKLDAQWQEKAITLEKSLGVSIIGRSRQQRLVVSKDYVDEVLNVDGNALYYRQIEGGFTQPNAYINQHMLAWAKVQSKNLNGDLLELYCGNGNFTVALAQHFDKVLATEISKPSVKSAQYNFATNNINNVQVCRMSSEDITTALNKERTFRRLVNNDIDLDNYQFSTVLVDPPRAGLDDATLALIQRFDHILYISCNPETLCNNLKQLCETHTINKAALFDQFPYTEHIETGVFLTRR